VARPNVVYILADDLGFGDLGCLGNEWARTPAVDRLAGEGVRLTQHYSGSPVCAPARACLLTGRYPHRTGAIDVEWIRGADRLGLHETTLADVLAAHGVATGLVGKWHLGSGDPRFHPNRRGFREFVGLHHGISDYYDWRLDRNGAALPADGRYLTDVLTDEAVDFVRRHRSEPFFLYLAYNAPHTPLQAPEDEVRRFAETGRFSDAVCRIYAMIARMNQGIGRVLEELEALGIADDTIVIFASDNGPHFAGQGEADQRRFNADLRGHKYLVYEGGVRVPAVVRWPAGLPAGTTVTEPVHFADWFPTLLRAAGAPMPPGVALDGEDVWGVLRGKPAAATAVEGRTQFWQWNRYTPLARNNAAMREGDWKLVYPLLPETNKLLPHDAALRRKLDRGELTFDEIQAIVTPEPDYSGLASPPAQLFNLADDPSESQDRVTEEPERAARMVAALDTWFEAIEAERTSRAAGF
jgi:arylsulfatase A-like enzyme